MGKEAAVSLETFYSALQMTWLQTDWFIVIIFSAALAILSFTGWLWWRNRKAEQIDASLEINAADQHRLNRIEAALRPHEKPPPSSSKTKGSAKEGG